MFFEKFLFTKNVHVRIQMKLRIITKKYLDDLIINFLKK